MNGAILDLRFIGISSCKIIVEKHPYGGGVVIVVLAFFHRPDKGRQEPSGYQDAYTNKDK
jgi:hypothetical protein